MSIDFEMGYSQNAWLDELKKKHETNAAPDSDIENDDENHSPTPQEIDKKVAEYTEKLSVNPNAYEAAKDDLFVLATTQDDELILPEIKNDYFSGWQSKDFIELLRKLGETETVKDIKRFNNDKNRPLALDIHKAQFRNYSVTEDSYYREQANKEKLNEKETATQKLKEIKNFATDALPIIDEKIGFFEKDTRFNRLAELLKDLSEKLSIKPKPIVESDPNNLPYPEIMRDYGDKTKKELLSELNRAELQLIEALKRNAEIRQDSKNLDARFPAYLEAHISKCSGLLREIKKITEEPKPGLFKEDTRADQIRKILTQITETNPNEKIPERIRPYNPL